MRVARVHRRARPPVRPRARRASPRRRSSAAAPLLIPSIERLARAPTRCARRLDERLPPGRPRTRGTGTARLVHLRARSAPRAGARSACWRSPRSPPHAPLRSEDLRAIEVFARPRRARARALELLEREAGCGARSSCSTARSQAVGRLARARGRLPRDRRAGGASCQRRDQGPAPPLRPGQPRARHVASAGVHRDAAAHALRGWARACSGASPRPASRT